MKVNRDILQVTDIYFIVLIKKLYHKMCEIKGLTQSSC